MDGNRKQSKRIRPRVTAPQSRYILDAQFVFRQYANFRRRMKESGDELEDPRKVVQCPESQFNLGAGGFSTSSYQAETFRFLGTDNVPYTKHGRNVNGEGREGQIKELISWKAEPLPLINQVPL